MTTPPTPITLADNVRKRLEERLPALRDGDEDLGIAGTARLKIFGALDLAQPAMQVPALVAIGLGEDTDPDLAPEGSTTVQRVLSTVGVIAAVPARNDPTGRKANDPLDALVVASRAVLVGWVPARRWAPLGLRRSRLLALEEGRAWWQDEYITSGWRGAARS